MTQDRTIQIRCAASDDPLVFEVAVRESGTESRHRVTLAKADCDRLTGRRYTPEQCVEAAFRFLLDREPKESILSRFDLNVISRYFPKFEHELPRYLAGKSA
jgi:hypothetical protein